MNISQRLSIVFSFAALPVTGFAANQLTVTAVNHLNLARPSQTLELSAKDLAPLSEKDLARIHVRDAAGKELLCQAVDTDYDAYHTPDTVIFQADFAPSETKTFTVFKGAKPEFSKEQFKAFGRFVRERFDDFAWENDRIAHRTYGKALETWEGEPLCSSTIDIWSKRTPRMVINDWYMLDNYHEDMGEGFDDYSAGLSRGDGGNGLWAADQLWVSRNFTSSRTLANGPIRVMFELTYEPFNVNGISVAEVKRVTLDAGQNLDHYQSFYKSYTRPGQSLGLTTGIGLKKVKGEQVEFNAGHGWLLSWQDMEKNAGKQGVAIVADPKLVEKQTEDKLNNLLLAMLPENNVASYWAGFAWDKASPFKDADAWKQYVDEFAQGLQSPIEISVSEK
ncbi:MAG TPA: DUF4861 family protein [Candidatus Acidoferrum sp.]|nr:DUF4861 family protein [Candidatus Acidoferrum sp.]